MCFLFEKAGGKLELIAGKCIRRNICKVEMFFSAPRGRRVRESKNKPC